MFRHRFTQLAPPVSVSSIQSSPGAASAESTCRKHEYHYTTSIVIIACADLDVRANLSTSTACTQKSERATRESSRGTPP